ncbi:hypothetical protein [Veillonella sp. 3310]|mgnify:CR=1 FL=1|uniref:hypothetical protein n=1 Tax=Veillonella sp. 3310 TaxID=2490956 RepID=UPI000FD6925E|nr:hypothetical protein [Veillonella sp. 3310]
MHYIFDSTGSCVITSQSPIEPIEGYTHVESTEVYNPWEIRLVDGAIVKQEPKEEPPNTHTEESTDKQDEPAEVITPTVEELAKSVAGLYGILAEIAPKEESEEDTADESTGKETKESEG